MLRCRIKKVLAEYGRAIISTFSLCGPAQCSGPDVMRFDAQMLASELGYDFKLIRDSRVKHNTPWGSKQSFQYCEFQM